jgi:ubiquitin C-terminal hydrolase
MTIYKAPKVLILHLKRFKQKGLIKKEKNESKVIFPTVLDMKPYLIDPRPISSYIEEAKNRNIYIAPKYP